MGGQGTNLHLHQMPDTMSLCLDYSSSYLLFHPGLIRVSLNISDFHREAGETLGAQWKSV